MAEHGFEALLDQIYTAGVDSAHWSLALETLNHGLQSAGCALILVEPGSSARFSHIVGVNPADAAAYEQHYIRINPWPDGVARKPVGAITTGAEVFDPNDLRRTEFYNGWLRPQGLHDSICFTIGRSNGALLTLSALRLERTGFYSDRDKRYLARAAPHIKRAVDIHRTLFAAQVLRDGLACGLDGLGVGVLLIGSGCRVLFANRVAEAILKNGNGLTCRHGRLRATTPEADEELDRRICTAVATGLRLGEDAGGVVVLPTSKGLRIVVLVSPCRSKLTLGDVDPAAILFVSDPDSEARIDEHRIARIYGLTRAEARLLGALLQGKRLAEYADETGITLNTAKGYLKHLLSKTGTSRQTDLMRLALSDPILRMVPS